MFMLYYILLYYINYMILYYIILYHIMLYYIILYYSVLDIYIYIEVAQKYIEKVQLTANFW